ncbi:MAG TPA: ammonium transporter [Actinomycetota bacterium]|nr:ammonium transporter [Actinomycetota bacterium]
MNSGDTAFVLISAALVMFMTPGLALFYGGMVRAKNVLGTVMQSVFALGLVSVLWVLVGYSLAFGPDKGHLIGGLDYLGFSGVGQNPNPALSATIPHLAYAAFQLMFAVITPALITGAFAERMKFSGYVVFTSLWLLLIYAPLAHWVWAPGGWIRELGALDFAGGTVVHMNSGAAALAAAIIIGKRKGFGTQAHVPHNLPLTILGAGILWFGWFGFNAGSALAANGLAASAFIATNTAAAAGACGWALFDALKSRKSTTLGMASGAVAGLVAITPAAGFVGPMASVAIGLAAGLVCAWAVGLKFRAGFDDALDVVGVHMVGGMLGALLIGIFGNAAFNPAGADGLLAGGGLALLGKQAVAVLATFVFSFGGSFVLLKLVQVTVGLRVTEEEEAAGLDLAQHAETGYSFSEGAGGFAPVAGHGAPAPTPPPAQPVRVPQGDSAS